MLQRVCMNSQENFSELLRTLQRDREISRPHATAMARFRRARRALTLGILYSKALTVRWASKWERSVEKLLTPGPIGVAGRQFRFLLFLLVVWVSSRAVAQTAGSDADIPRGLAAQEALSVVSRSAADTASLQSNAAIENGGNARKVIVIGFMGGFAKSDDQKHPEVQFAQYLQEHYRSDIHAEVFGNHHGRKALQEVQRLLDGDGDGTLSSAEKEDARIIIYGHSWGATETVVFARELGKRGIPVLLTVQVDSIAKPGRDNSMIPANVAKAINFYQSGGPLHGRAEIFAADPAQTKIIGNLHMTYEGRSINCDNYPWFARTFNKPHHEIENDPRVWTVAASLIDSEFAIKSPATAPQLASRLAASARQMAVRSSDE
jgi:hypothetical protein